jgi:hypothetical protein
MITGDLTFFALIDDSNIVIKTFVMSHEKVATGIWGDPEKLVEYTNYTLGGVYFGDDDITPIGYNTPSVGYNYDHDAKAFISPRPYPSWLLDTATFQWQPPTPYPSDGNMYTWDEETLSWVQVNV